MYDQRQKSEIKVSDFDMPFGSMIWFMLKWAFASIPAMIIFSAVFGAIVFVGILILAALGLSIGSMPHK